MEARPRGNFIGGAGNYTRGFQFTEKEIAALNLNSQAESYYLRTNQAQFDNSPLIKCPSALHVGRSTGGSQIFFILTCVQY